MKRTTLTILLLLNLLIAFAQSKPVTVIVNLTPPYSPFLNEYASTTSSRLQVTLIVNDSRMINYPVKLQLFVERPGSGVAMRTAEYASIPPILLNGGMTEVLSGASLSQYFQAQNNVFTGFDQAQYLQTGRIPDGQYRIGFQVVDAQRSEVKLSNLTFSQPGWFLLNDPPQLNLPRNNVTERVNDPQAIKLEWFPRHLGSMNSAFATSYQVELFALRVPGMNPQQIALSLPPDYTTITNQTSFMLNQHKHLLEPGVEYAWRVKAMAGDGFTLFQNKGYSEVFSFVYGQLCPKPEKTEALPTGTESAEISWETDLKQCSYIIRYRLKSEEEAIWHEKESYSSSTEIANVLSPGTAYEYQVKAKCTTTESEYSPIKTFTTQQLPPVNFDCGKKDTAGQITNFTPKLQLKPGDIIYNGKFPVKLTKVEGAAGTYNGEGRMRIPMLANIQINMKFTGLKVNEENQVFGGEMVSVYNEDSKFFIEDLSDYFGEGDQIGNVISGQDSAAIILTYEVTNPDDLDITIDGDNVVVTGGGGTTYADVDDAGNGTTIVDSEGNIFVVEVDDNGNTTVTEVGTSGGTGTSGSDYNDNADTYNQLDNDITVTFYNNGKWAFDQRNPKYEGSVFDSEYEKIGDYYVPWKFVPLAKADKIKARVTSGTIEDPEKLKFLTPTGTEFFAEYKNGDYLLEVIGAKERDGMELYPIYMPDENTKISVGKLKIASYPRLDMKVKLVPMDDFRIDGIISEDVLNEIYNPYYIHWHINIDAVFSNTSWDDDGKGLQGTGSEFYSMFTPEMRALNAAYKEERGVDEESLYLFIFPDGNSEGNLLGDMPLKSRFGYIFNAEGADTRKITQTVAHELGHGAFQLKHTFSDKYNIAKTSTEDNLMDYPPEKEKAANYIKLVKYQWDVVHDPQNKLFNWSQGEEEGQQTERPSTPINRKLIVNWLKEHVKNKNQGVNFNKPDFYFDPYIHEIDESKSIVTEGQSVPLQVKLNNNGVIDFQSDNNNFGIAISIPGLGQKVDYGRTDNLPKESDYHTSFYLYFNYQNKLDPAVILYTNSFTDFELLLREIGMNLSNLEENISTFYKKAIGIADNDRDKLDVIFETIPPFVLDALTDKEKWEYLLVLKHNTSTWGTDECKAIANLLNGFSTKFLYDKILENKKLFREILRDARDDIIYEYIYPLCKVGNSNWTDEQINNTGDTYACVSKYDAGFETFPFIGIDAHCLIAGKIVDADENEVSNFNLGYCLFQFRNSTSTVYENDDCSNIKKYDFFNPVKVYLKEGESLTVPAFVAYELVKREIENNNVFKTYINNAFYVLMPELTFVKFKNLTRLFKAKNTTSIDDLIKNLPEVKGVVKGSCPYTAYSGAKALQKMEGVVAKPGGMLYPKEFENLIGKTFKKRIGISPAGKPISRPWVNATELKTHLRKLVRSGELKEGSVGIIHLNRGLGKNKETIGHYCNFIIKDKNVIFVDFAKAKGQRVFTNPNILDESLHAFGKSETQGYRYVDVTDVEINL